MNQAPDEPSGERPQIRKVGRRRVVSGEPSATVPGQTRDDVDEPSLNVADDDHLTWLRSQRPPHWE